MIQWQTEGDLRCRGFRRDWRGRRSDRFDQFSVLRLAGARRMRWIGKVIS